LLTAKQQLNIWKIRKIATVPGLISGIDESLYSESMTVP
jgi:hypothetical protein